MARLFFRNDDVADLTPRLQAFTRLFLDAGIPVHHGLIPGRATEAVVAWLTDLAKSRPGLIGIDLHGWGHDPYGGSPEFGPHVPRAVQQERLARGLDWMRSRFGALFSGIFVPPHNCYNRTTVTTLDELGYAGLSGSVGRRSRLRRLVEPVAYAMGRGDLPGWNGRRFPGTAIVQCSVTIDPVLDYRAGTMMTVANVLSRLDEEGTQGICLHHWVGDESMLMWVRTLLGAVRGRTFCRMTDIVSGLC